MLKQALHAALLTALTTTATAHEIWLERDGAGPARVYFGEPVDAPNPDELKSLKNPVVFNDNPAQPAKLTAQTDHLQAAVGTGDVRLFADDVFKPWQNKQGKMQAAIFSARAGRSETKAALDFELVPVAANGNAFTVTWQGKPLPGHKVTVINPDKWEKTFTADEAGRVELPLKDKGRYILASRHEIDAQKDVGGVKVDKLAYTTTPSFLVQ